MMITKIGLIALVWAGLQGALGYGAYYSPGVMERVESNRGITPDAPCRISWTEAQMADIQEGKTFLVRGLRTGKIKRCQVLDMPQRAHLQRIRHKRILVELRYEDMLEICGYPGAPRECPVWITPTR